MLKSYFQRFFIKKQKRGKRNFLRLIDAPFQLEEAYKALRTNLQFVCADKNIKKILITSSAPGEGKSTVTINLAIALAQVGHKVIILDCDMRKPKIHTYLKKQNFPGITNVLAKTNTLDEAIQYDEELGIYMIPCGPVPPNPAELIETKLMENALNELGEKFDFVLIDSPPASFITDASVLSKYADGVLMVFLHRSITFEIVDLTIKNLKSAGANILGGILNNVDTEKTGRYNYYRNYNYYRYYAAYYESNSYDKRIKKSKM
ncbi:MAG: CpsD/CapB family tyrosine-protein kinase [Bacillota bacterium]